MAARMPRSSLYAGKTTATRLPWYMSVASPLSAGPRFYRLAGANKPVILTGRGALSIIRKRRHRTRVRGKGRRGLTMEVLSDRQRQMMEFISDYLAEHDRPPTNREIGQAMGIASTGHVDYHLSVLAKKGYIEREPNTSRGLRLTPVSEPHPRRRVYNVPVLGLIAAGS